jgi:hypothetical protein
MRLLVIEARGTQPTDLTIGALVDGVRDMVMADLKNDTPLTTALATAIANHLTATVRPT